MDIEDDASIFTLQYSLDTINTAAAALLKSLGNIKVWLLEGEMGAGKTTLIKEICRVLHVSDNVTSPTYSLVNEYRTLDEQVVFHFDFYRIKSETEAMDIGCEEYFYSGNYCFIEWPSKIPSLLPEKFGIITINITGDEQRQCNVSLK